MSVEILQKMKALTLDIGRCLCNKYLLNTSKMLTAALGPGVTMTDTPSPPSLLKGGRESQWPTQRPVINGINKAVLEG